MDYYVSPEEFRELLESRIVRENERLLGQDPETSLLQIVDGRRKINIPDEGSLIFREKGSSSSPSMPLYELRTGYCDWMDRGGFGHTESLQDSFFQKTFQTMEEEVTKHFNADLEIARISDPEIALGRIFPCICETERNRELLSEIPHREIYDLSIYYRIRMDVFEDPGLRATVIVRNHMMDQWTLRSEVPITEETLYARAYENEQKESMILDMEDVMMDFYQSTPGLPAEERLYTMPEPEYEKMFIVTNRMKYHGAADALMGIGMEEFAGQKDMDFYILPSSVHESILIGDDGMFQPGELAGFVRSVNQSEVSLEDRLSDSVYFYDHKTRSIEIAYDAEAARQKYQAQANSRSYVAGQQTPRRGR